MYKVTKVPFPLLPHIFSGLGFLPFVFLLRLSPLVFITVANYVCLLYVT